MFSQLTTYFNRFEIYFEANVNDTAYYRRKTLKNDVNLVISEIICLSKHINETQKVLLTFN